MSTIIRLPDILCMDILSNWGVAKDLASLDSGFCSKTARHLLIAIFSCPHFVLSAPHHDYFSWTIRRGIKVKNMDLKGRFIAKLITEEQNICFSGVSSMKLTECTQAQLSCS